MQVHKENSSIKIISDSKWSPIKGMLFGIISGTAIGIVNESVEAGISVFAVVSIAGILLTLYERLSIFKEVIVDFNTHTLVGKNIFLGHTIKSLKIDSFDSGIFYFSHYDSSKKFFRKYYLNFKHPDKSYTLILLAGKETLKEVSEFLEQHGIKAKIQGQRIGQFLVQDG